MPAAEGPPEVNHAADPKSQLIETAA